MGLLDLLGDQSPAQFVAEYYQRLPYSFAGTAAHLCELGSWDLLQRVLSQDNTDVMVARRGERVAVASPRSAADAQHLADDGCTVLVRHAERHDARLNQLATGFQQDLGGQVNIHIYATPPEQFGFGWHYDAEEVFIVQTAGVKEYSLRKNTVNPWPLEETLPTDMRYEREIMPLVRCSLAAGDWLYIPSGYWHMAAAKETSISLAIGVTPRTGIDAFDLLRPRLLDSLVWRQRLPVAGGAAALDQQQQRAAYRELLRQWADELGRLMTSDALVDELIDLQRTSPSEGVKGLGGVMGGVRHFKLQSPPD